jgi:hypothetical protein
MKDAWFCPVYLCKLCGKKIVDIRKHQSVNHEDLGVGLSNLAHSSYFDENSRLHEHIDGCSCLGLCSLIGFQER